MTRRGWVPEWLPRDASHVVLRYNLDTNFIWLNFKLTPANAAELKQRLRGMRHVAIDVNPKTGDVFTTIAESDAVTANAATTP